MTYNLENFKQWLINNGHRNFLPAWENIKQKHGNLNEYLAKVKKGDIVPTAEFLKAAMEYLKTVPISFEVNFLTLKLQELENSLTQQKETNQSAIKDLQSTLKAKESELQKTRDEST